MNFLLQHTVDYLTKQNVIEDWAFVLARVMFLRAVQSANNCQDKVYKFFLAILSIIILKRERK
jgi:hypothetical protein